MSQCNVVTEYEQGTDNSKQIFAELRRVGYTLIGSGLDATIWGKDEGEVLKVIMPSDNKELAEQSFLKFVNMCQSMPGNPFVPEFIGEHEVFEINGTPYMQITMERLHPIAANSLEEAMAWALSDLCTSPHIKWRDVVELITVDDFWRGYGQPAAAITAQVKTALAAPQGQQYYRQLFKTMQTFFVRGRRQGLGWDLHTENVMQRSDGTLVITDPFFTS